MPYSFVSITFSKEKKSSSTLCGILNLKVNAGNGKCSTARIATARKLVFQLNPKIRCLVFKNYNDVLMYIDEGTNKLLKIKSK